MTLNLLALSLLHYSMFLGTVAKCKLLIPFEKLIKLLPHCLMKRRVKNTFIVSKLESIHIKLLIVVIIVDFKGKKNMFAPSFFIVFSFLFSHTRCYLEFFFLNHICGFKKKRCNPNQDFKQLKTSKSISNAHLRS